ncbi:hypothetical protein ASD78_13305 [Lysobacter sp. Root667]|nr:hypothetical protein ASD78_13305 [Lysobacter sp. Root667]
MLSVLAQVDYDHADQLTRGCASSSARFGRREAILGSLAKHQPAQTFRGNAVAVQRDEVTPAHAPAGPRAGQIYMVVHESPVEITGARVRARLALRPAWRAHSQASKRRSIAPEPS